jgi:Tfp pilus assembly protein PilN
MPQKNDILKDFRKLFAFGTGVGIEIGATDLTVVAVRVRPRGVRVTGRLVIEDYASRPAAEWGAEYQRFLKRAGADRVSATVLLPRREVIVRHVALPGVSRKDIEGALRFQLDSLHPYGEDEISWAWSPLAYGNVLVGIVRRQTVDRYITLFAEAGIAVASFTFSAAAVHAAVRVNPQPRPTEGFVALGRAASGGVEVYGESVARPVFSAEFELAPERAAALALSELRLPASTELRTLEEVLPKPQVNPVENDLSRNARPYATALAGACPRLAPAANVLPPEHRRFSSRAVFIPSMVLGAMILLVVGSMVAYASWSEKHYLQQIQAEIDRLEPIRKRMEALEKQTQQARTRAVLLDQFRQQTRKDLEALNELTRIVEPPTWTNGVQMYRDNVRLSGETPQTALLLRILDSSPYFERTEIVYSSPNPKGEGFQVVTKRRSGK